MTLKEKSILIFVADEYEDLELQYPKIRMIEAGAKVTIAGPEGKATYQGKHGLPCQSDVSFDEVQVSDYDGLIIPGGYAPDKLRVLPQVIKITKEFNQQKKMIAFICHAGWIPISAQILKGVKCTSVASIKDDLVNAGADWADQPVIIDRHFISSRKPDDLPQFCSAIIDFLAKKK